MDRKQFLNTLKQGVEMNKLKVNRNKYQHLSKEELENLTKEELVDIVLRLQTSNLQLKNVIIKKNYSQNIVDETKKDDKKSRKFDFNKHQSRRVFLRIAYLGAAYHGLAVQEDCPDTVEAHLFSALVKGCLIKSRQESSYHRCGRTDKGVSASGQVISIEVRSRLSIEEQLSLDGGRNSELQYCKILNRLLPQDIRAVAWMPAPLAQGGEYYSARFDCVQRTYKYWFPRGSLDIEAMSRACNLLCGSHDFRNLCKMDVANGVTSFVRHVTEATIVKEKPEEKDNGFDMYYLLVKANAFLWHQIRCMAGLLFIIGDGYEDPEIISKLLDVEANPRKPQYNMAIDLPLNLFHCAYNCLKDYEDTTDSVKIISKESTTPSKSTEAIPTNTRGINDKTISNTENIENIEHKLKHNRSLEKVVTDNDTIDKTNEEEVRHFRIDGNEKTDNGDVSIDSMKFNETTVVTNSGNKETTSVQLIEEDSLMNDLSLKELDAIEEQVLCLDKEKGCQETESNLDNDGIECIEEINKGNLEDGFETVEKLDESSETDQNKGNEDCFELSRNRLSEIEPMDLSEDSLLLSGRFVVKKDWWYVDTEDLGLVIKSFQSQWAKFAIQASMIRDIIAELQALYNRELSSTDGGSIEFKHQAACMLHGVKPKIYQPLLKRAMCESLENRIEHYVNKKRLRKSSKDTECSST